MFQPCLNVLSTQIVLLIPLASTENVLIHAQNQIHALEMQIVVFHCIVLFVSVHQDGEEIRKCNVTNVSLSFFFYCS